VNDTAMFSHAGDDDPDGDGLSLARPIDRLCRLIEAGGTYKVVAFDELLGGQDAAAVVRCGSSIALNPRLTDEQIRTEVLAMAIAVTSSAPDGAVIVISTERDPGAHSDADRVTTGMIATMLAQQHGLYTVSAAFRSYMAEYPA
jgi:hypothetical protein